MDIDLSLQSKADNYKLLTNLVVPRPIAWVSTIGREGIINLAPFSFFNAVRADTLYVIVSLGCHENGALKDTAANIEASGDFVVNLVTEDLLAAMNISAADFPPDQSELPAAGLLATPSVRVKAPRIVRAQAILECRLHHALALGANTLFIGEVVMFHVADELLGPRLHVDRFELARFTYDPSCWRRPETEPVLRVVPK